MTKVTQHIIEKTEEGVRLDRWFKRCFPETNHIMIEKALRKGHIRVNGKRVKGNYRVVAGDEIRVPPFPKNVSCETLETKKKQAKKQPPKQAIQQLKESVIFEDKNIIILNKPAGLAVQGGSGVAVCVDELSTFLVKDGEPKPKLVHRLDKDTSGVLVLAKNPQAATVLTEAFRSKKAQKTYLAICIGQPPKKREGVIDAPLTKMGASGQEKIVVDHAGQSAKTLYRIVETLPNGLSLVMLSPVTGRTHQLRVHMQSIGMPILGDGKYGGKEAFVAGLSKKMSLHAYHIFLPNILGKKIDVLAPLSLHMQENFATLGFEAPSKNYLKTQPFS